MSALIRFYFQVNPDELSDEEFYKLWGELEFCLIFDGKLKVSAPRKG